MVGHAVEVFMMSVPCKGETSNGIQAQRTALRPRGTRLQSFCRFSVAHHVLRVEYGVHGSVRRFVREQLPGFG